MVNTIKLVVVSYKYLSVSICNDELVLLSKFWKKIIIEGSL